MARPPRTTAQRPPAERAFDQHADEAGNRSGGKRLVVLFGRRGRKPPGPRPAAGPLTRPRKRPPQSLRRIVARRVLMLFVDHTSTRSGTSQGRLRRALRLGDAPSFRAQGPLRDNVPAFRQGPSAGSMLGRKPGRAPRVLRAAGSCAGIEDQQHDRAARRLLPSVACGASPQKNPKRDHARGAQHSGRPAAETRPAVSRQKKARAHRCATAAGPRHGKKGPAVPEPDRMLRPP